MMLRKNFFFWILIVVLLVGLMACGSKGDGGNSAGNTGDAKESSSGENYKKAKLEKQEDGSYIIPEEGGIIDLEGGNSLFLPGTEMMEEDPESGLRYTRGIIVVYTFPGTGEEEQKAIADAVDGEVIGSVHGFIGFFQIGTSAQSLAEIESLCEKVRDLPGVLDAGCDMIMELGSQTEADNNPWNGSASEPITDKGNEKQPGGNDWWAEAIRAYSAWKAIPMTEEQALPIGQVDNGWDTTQQPDLFDRLQPMVYKTEEDGRILPFIIYQKNDGSSGHATHVAGIMAARNDEVGIRGIADKSKILCMNYWKTDLANNTKENVAYAEEYTNNGVIDLAENGTMSTGYYLYGINTMLEHGVRVINHSNGYNGYFTEKDFNDAKKKNPNVFPSIDTYAAYKKQQEVKAFKSGRETVGLMITLLVNLQLENPDEDPAFLMVQSAGNGSIASWTAGEKDKNGDDIYYPGESIGIDAGMNLLYASITEDAFIVKKGQLLRSESLTEEQRTVLEGITWKDITDHYIIVGGTGKKTEDGCYEPEAHLNYGAAVDIYTPAVDIYSTMPWGKWDAKGGTSLAAPMVSGAATLLWSAEPELPTGEIKAILKECTDQSCTDDHIEEERPFLNVGMAAEYMKYYMYVRDIMIPKYGLQKGAQDGITQSYDESWLEPEGIVTAWIGDMDGETGSEMVVFRFERDPDSDYSNQEYKLVLDLFTINDGTVQILDTQWTDFALTEKYSKGLDMTVYAYPQGDRTDLLIAADTKETDLHSLDLHYRWRIPLEEEKLMLKELSLREGDSLVSEATKRIFNISNENNREDKSQDHWEFRAMDGCRLTWYLDFVFTDRNYVPA